MAPQCLQSLARFPMQRKRGLLGILRQEATDL